MKICVIPFNIKWAEKEENILSAAHELSQVDTDTDVVVLPELFTTGFIPSRGTVERLAEDNDGKTVRTLKRWAQFFGFAIAGSFLATNGKGYFYNRAFFIEPHGDATYYDKRHLFPLSKENRTYTPGSTLSPIVHFRGWDIKLIVCFDLRFPVWCRNEPGRLFDIMLVPSNWPHSREYQYKTLLSARAIENQIFTVGANCTGEDKFGSYLPGQSSIYDNLGATVHETRKNGHLYAIMNRQTLIEGRKKFPAYEAADVYTIDLTKRPEFNR